MNVGGREGTVEGGGTRERILTAASRLFRERGYDGTSIGAIAKAVPISPPTLYWHFAAKREILFCILESTLRDFQESVHAAIDADAPTEQLRQIATAHVRWQLDRPELAGTFRGLYGSGALLEHLPADQQEALRALIRVHVTRCMEIVRAGVADGSFDVPDVSATTMAIITMCEYVISWYRDHGRLDSEAIAMLHGELAVRMAGGR